MEKVKCPRCGSVKIIFDYSRGEAYCLDCGYTFEVPEIMYQFKEWREFDEEDAERRRGGDSIITQVHARQAEARVDTMDLRKLPPEIKQDFREIKIWEQRVDSNWERNLKYALTEIERLSELLNLPDIVRDDAAKFYKKAAERGLVKGRSIDAMVAATVYAACRIHKIPRTMDEVVKAVGDLNKDAKLTRKEIGKVYRFLLRELNIKTPPADPMEYLEKIASMLGLSQRTIEIAKKILEDAEKMEITSGKGPTGLAAAAIYIASLITGEKRTQREVATIAGVTEVTIRNRYKELVEKLNLEEKIQGKIS